MKPEKVNSWLTLVANFGVLVGIILLVIELDDKSHQRKDRRKRDKFVNKVLKGKHPLLRLTTEQSKDHVLVKRKIEQALGEI